MIASNIYPIPAVLGGSIESLIQYFLKENIKNNRVDLTLYSIDNPMARKVHSELFKEANIIYINRTMIDKLWDRLWPVNRVFLKVFKKQFLANPYIKRVYKNLKNMDYDYIIFEGNYYEKCDYLYKKVGRKRLIIHWHGEIVGHRILAEWFSKHICISNYVARVLTCNGYINANDALVLKNCINLELFSQTLTSVQRIELLSNYNISENDFVISFIGRIVPEKGVRELLLAFKDVCSKNPNCKLLIIGSSAFGYEEKTAYETEMEKIAESMNAKIVFTGFVHHDEMWKLLKLSNVSVFPSIWNEGAGMVGLEIMAASVPLITFNVGGISEYVDKDVCVMLDWDKNIVRKLSDSILSLTNNKEKLAEMSMKGYAYVQKYSTSIYYNNYCDLLYAIDAERNLEK